MHMAQDFYFSLLFPQYVLLPRLQGIRQKQNKKILLKFQPVWYSLRLNSGVFQIPQDFVAETLVLYIGSFDDVVVVYRKEKTESDYAKERNEDGLYSNTS